MTAAEIEAALRKRFAWPEWVMFTEVSTNYGQRRADAIAMNMWSSRGFEIVGFEIKVDRGDLLRELKSPAKAEETGKYCDKWSLVTPAGLVQIADMIPEGWGLFEVYPSGRIEMKIKPAKREAQKIDRQFISVMLRRAAAQDEHDRAEAIRTAAAKLAEQEVKQARERGEQNMQHLKDRHERLQGEVNAFQNATGLRIHDAPEVCQAIKVIKNLGTGRIRGRIDEIIGTYGRIEGDIRSMKEIAEALKNEMSSAEAPAGWTSVKDKMPGTQDCIVYTEDGYTTVATFDAGTGYWDMEGGMDDCEVTHWMPLPKPPSKERGRTKCQYE